MYGELFKVRIIAIFVSIIMILIILDLIKRRKLDINYSIIWLATGILILVCSSSQKIIYFLADFLDIKAPVNLFYIIILFFIISVLLHFSIVLTRLMRHTTKLAQDIALLGEKIKNKIEARK